MYMHQIFILIVVLVFTHEKYTLVVISGVFFDK